VARSPSAHIIGNTFEVFPTFLSPSDRGFSAEKPFDAIETWPSGWSVHPRQGDIRMNDSPRPELDLTISRINGWSTVIRQLADPVESRS
jgi:hypothetical protein